MARIGFAQLPAFRADDRLAKTPVFIAKNDLFMLGIG